MLPRGIPRTNQKRVFAELGRLFPKVPSKRRSDLAERLCSVLFCRQQKTAVPSRFDRDSEERENVFRVDFNTVWEVTGYSRKDSALRTLTSNQALFKEGKDYLISRARDSRRLPQHGGHNRQDIFMTVKCFAKFLAVARTPEADALKVFFSRLGCAHFMLLEGPSLESRSVPRAYFLHKRRAEEDLETDLKTFKRSMSEHDRVVRRLAVMHGGESESRLDSGVIVDVLTDEEVIEVKPVSEWMHGLGQALAYAHETGLKPRLHLLEQPGAGSIAREVCSANGVALSWERLHQASDQMEEDSGEGE